MKGIVGLFLVALIVYVQSLVLCTDTSKCGINQKACTRLNSYLFLTVELDNGNSQKRFYPFCLWVDELAQITLNGSFAWLSQSPGLQNSYVRMWVSKGYQTSGKDVQSDYRYFFDRSTAQFNSSDNSFALFFQAYVTMEQGKFYEQVSGNTTTYPIFFDQSMCQGVTSNGVSNYYCVLDTSQPCVNNVDCAAKESDWTTNPSTFNSYSKDVKILVGFSGTDSGLNYMKSANLMPSKFRQFSFASYYGIVASVTKPS